MPNLDPNLTEVFNQHLTQIKPSQIRSFSKEIKDIPGLISLNVGEPGFNTPEHIKKAAMASIAENKSHYSPQNGWLELRQTISDFLQQRLHLTYDPEQEVIVTDGATEALSSTFLATVNPGDQVLVPQPAYPAYGAMIELAGASVIPLDTSPNQFKIDPQTLDEQLTAYPEVKEIILNYPNNPTGVEYTATELEALAAVIQRHHLLVIADEIYSELTYSLPHTSIANIIPNSTILINGVSKSHAMTGYRLGYVAGPAAVVANINKVHGYLVTSPSNPAQYAAIEALQHGRHDTEPMLVEYQQRRDLVTETLRPLGFEIINPDGAFYIFAKIPSCYHESSREFCLRLAQEAHVGVTPGSAFGTSGEGYFRISYAANLAQIKQALTNIKRFVAETATPKSL
ncbi:aminotransferase class I/II-fold pyridoxal phosphate-dependent enzyme [Fructilactobacillus florum]|uniref:Aminotransferase n=1 Tax=Fructilactobacillus florum DSM 22689 = JCM 16035 TaxID=1423745 RepID=A0A0R2CI74_9LACO|nr:aminotransferase class I/II-fold pyridoxal phosphate-dependent enzyme [Fructilactobacillus florum]KRM91357.1 aminotransferase A [Fructilactobacillus florum DSM 22689 = JCM 16035]